MSYNIYTTDGIILKRTTFGEANIILYILTKDLGLIVASAQGARLSKSKLKGSLQEYSLVSVSLIKGKNGWKITNTSFIKNYFFDYPKYFHEILSKISKLLQKMIVGESRHPEIFDDIKNGFDFISLLEKEKIDDFEIILVLRILHKLGYVAKEEKNERFLSDNFSWRTDVLDLTKESKRELIDSINKALKESHL